MKRKIVTVAIVLVSIVLAVSSIVLVAFAANKIGENDFLHVESGNLVNEKGETVLLQGVNLGGWLIQESWMCPVSGENRKWANLDTLTVQMI